MEARTWVLSCLLLALLAGCPSSYGEPDTPPDLGPDLAAYLYTARDDVTEVRVRRLRPGVEIDCNLLGRIRGSLPAAAVGASLFDSGVVVGLVPGRTELVPRRTTDGCDLLRVELSNGSVELVEINPHTVQAIEITADGIHPDHGGWPEVDDATWQALDRCEPPSPAAAVPHWSEPVPVGSGLRIAALESRDGCMVLALETGRDGGEAFPWKICAGELALPVRVGDLLDISAPDPERRILRIDLQAQQPREGRTRIWLSRAALPLERGAEQTDSYLEAHAETQCRVASLVGCGTASLAGRVVVTLAGRTAQLREGERVRLASQGRSVEVLVARARFFPLLDPFCGAARDPTAGLSVVAIERGPAPAPAPGAAVVAR